jgi:hypothetical protein
MYFKKRNHIFIFRFALLHGHVGVRKLTTNLQGAPSVGGEK